MSEGTIAPEQIIINGQEYNPEDASSLIELGNKYREYEKNLNTSFDKLMPEYTKATQRAARLDEVERDREEMRKKLEAYEAKAKQVPEDKQKIITAAREAGLADQEWLKEQGYVRKDDLEKFFTEKDQQKALIDNVLKTANTLEKEIDGSDGRVPFDQRAVLAYASTYNVQDLKDAYEQMNERANARWKETQIEKAQRPGLTTMKPGGKKAPEDVKITDDNFKQLWDEMFSGTK